MSTLALERERIGLMPSWGWWAFTLVVVVATAWNPIVGAAFVVLGLLQRIRPMDFVFAYLLIVSRASFVNYTLGGGNITREMIQVVAGIVFALLCYALERRSRSIAIPKTALTRALAIWGVWSFINVGRGFLAGYGPRYIGLDILGPLGLLSAFLVANRGLSVAERRGSLLWLWLTGLGHCALGFLFFAMYHSRTGSIYFTPVPGILASFFLAFALRARSRAESLLWLLVIAPLLLHQFLSFTRGFWLSLLGVFAFSLFLFGGRSGNAGARWRHGLWLYAAVIGVFLGGTMSLMLFFDAGYLLDLAGARFGSITATKASYASGSNVARLLEYATVLRHVAQSPWIGHGLGFTYMDIEVQFGTLIAKWYTHNNYLYVWLKQGIIGVGIFVWMMVAALRLGIQGRKLEDPVAAAWCAGAAGATLFIMIYSNVHMPLADVNSVFVLAFLWGGAMAATKNGEWQVRWRRPD